jgi:hypothetical protein
LIGIREEGADMRGWIDKRKEGRGRGINEIKKEEVLCTVLFLFFRSHVFPPFLLFQSSDNDLDEFQGL